MGRKLDLTGQKFGYLTVKSFAFYSKKYKKNYWNCICDCGNEVQVAVASLMSGKTKSCGCYADTVRQNWIKTKRQAKGKYSGISKTKLYSSYIHMKTRCYNKSYDGYKYYGGRGITICDEWLNNPESFFEWAINNGWKDGLSIDRIDVNGNYEPGNCRWTTTKQQCNNTRRNKYITYNNETKTISEWADVLHINRHSLGNRLLKGWSVEKAFTTPIKTRGGK